MAFVKCITLWFCYCGLKEKQIWSSAHIQKRWLCGEGLWVQVSVPAPKRWLNLENEHHCGDQEGTAVTPLPEVPEKQRPSQGPSRDALLTVYWRNSQHREGHIPPSTSHVPAATLTDVVQDDKSQSKRTEKQYVSPGCCNYKRMLKSMPIFTNLCNTPPCAIHILSTVNNCAFKSISAIVQSKLWNNFQMCNMTWKYRCISNSGNCQNVLKVADTCSWLLLGMMQSGSFNKEKCVPYTVRQWNHVSWK